MARGASSSAATPSPHEVGQRIETLLDDLAGSGNSAAAAAGSELVQLLAQLYGEGLARITGGLHDAGPEGEALLIRLAGDDLVSALLALHGLHPVDLDSRIIAALDQVRPYLGSHAGGIEFLGVDDDGVARLRLEGSCDGCPSSALTVRTAVESAIEAAAPELAGIEVEGVVDVAAAAPAVADQPGLAPNGLPLLQIGPAPHRDDGRTEEWVDLAAPPGFHAGAVTTVGVDGVRLVLCGLGADVVAYRDRCPGCGGSLGTAELSGEVLGCRGCGARFDVRHAGAGVTPTTHALRPVPLLPDTASGGYRVAVGAAAGATPVGAGR